MLLAGVLDNTELSMLTGSQVKATRSPASGFSSTFSPLSRFGKSSNTSVLKEVGENSRGKFPSKCLSAENKGRKLFASSKASEQDERKAPAGTQDKSGTAQIQRIPKKSEPSPSVVSRSRSTSSVTNVPKPTTRPATVTSERTHKVEGLPLESKTERSSVIKSSGPTIGKNMVPTVTAICQETNGSGKCETFSPYSQDNPSSSVVAPAQISAKPSALRMPSPSVGFFTQGKASVSHSDNAQRNPERCFSGNISSLVKPLSLPVQPATRDPNVLASSLPGVEDTNVRSLKQSLSENQMPQFDSSTGIKPSLAYSQLDSNTSLCSEVQLTSSEGPDIDSEMELDTDDAFTVEEPPLLHVGGECDHDYRSAECSHMNLAAPSPRVDQKALAGNLTEKVDTADGRTESHHCSTQERRPILSEEQDTEDTIEFDTKLSSSEGASSIERIKSVGKSRTNTISKDHLKNLVPFTEEWLAVMEAFGEEVLEQKTGAVQNSPTDKAAPEPSPWSPVKRKAQDVGPFDCTKYSKNVRTSD
uniref:Uncharacterized protein n=1 Tax=Oryza nivara TaxID=4536 RepID=A0A0E0J5Q2_ORYNI